MNDIEKLLLLVLTALVCPFAIPLAIDAIDKCEVDE